MHSQWCISCWHLCQTRGCAGREEAQPWDEDIGAGDDVFGLAPRTPPVRVGGELGPKAHVLVCAPSNSALDEIVLRLLSHGLLDQCGHPVV